ncbi:Uncharacterized protein TPAR_01029 [Tolypocladium paradoxum]|uniref:F-box domain-containing protein n=1 Tax=Tolypocladium paradoxum TaxID=94208 RepID=A0A2S4L8N6_9HYPO|nr:Uncharacterized protein TPAR_01029 [Tolypocladium paradoxum]
MTLTPVRIRGKRKASSIKTPTTLAPQPRKMKRSLASVVASRSTRRRATLESLPSEMLESILLYSTNLSLPRASPVIGSKLSDRATLLRLFIWAFHETWQQWFGIPASQPICHVPQVASVQQVQCQGDHALQSAMLEMPWAKIDFILQAQQAWADRYARDRWYQHSIPWQEDPGDLGHHDIGGFSHFNARECFEMDFQQALKWPPFFVESVKWNTQEVHPLARMPTDLITGPWDDEKLRRLFWLSRGGIKVDGGEQTLPPWEVKLQCMDNAVLSAPEPNVLVVNCLMGSWVFTDLPRDVVRKQLVGLDRRIEWGGDTPESRAILRRTRNTLDLFLHSARVRHAAGSSTELRLG